MKSHMTFARMILALAALIVAGVVASGCAATTLPRIQPLPTEIAAVERDMTAVRGNLLQLLTMTARTAVVLSRLEDEAATSGSIPPAADAAFDKAMVAYADASSRAAKVLSSGAARTYAELVAFMSRSPVVALVVEGPEDTWEIVRGMMGTTNPRSAAPGTIRGDYGTIFTENLVHGSDSAASAAREIGIFFPNL